MIDFEISPRSSGKTTELINMYNENVGMFVTIPGDIKRFNIEYIISYQRLKEHLYYIKGFEWLYFDNFFNQREISYNDIIQLDKLGKNIKI